MFHYITRPFISTITRKFSSPLITSTSSLIQWKFTSQTMQTMSHKTSKTAAKRFIVTKSGNLKYGHAGKAHLNRTKSRTRLHRLNGFATLKGTWLKKMKRLL